MGRSTSSQLCSIRDSQIRVVRIPCAFTMLPIHSARTGRCFHLRWQQFIRAMLQPPLLLVDNAQPSTWLMSSLFPAPETSGSSLNPLYWELHLKLALPSQASPDP